MSFERGGIVVSVSSAYMAKMRGKWLLFAGTVLLLSVAAGTLSVLRKPQPGPAAAPPKPPAEEAGPEVSLPGKIAARNIAAIAAPIDGIVEEISLAPGVEVFEGQLLARISNGGLNAARDVANADAERAQAKLTSLEGAMIAARLEASRAEADASRARADAERAEKVFERQRMLMREGATPRLVYEKAEKEFRRATTEADNLTAVEKQAAERVEFLTRDIDLAKRNVDEKNDAMENLKLEVEAGDVVSPVDGILIAVRAQPGDEVTRAIKDLFQIAIDLGNLEIAVEPTPPQLARIKAGQPALVHLTESGHEGLPGEVREVKDGKAVIDFQSPDPSIKPGLTAQVRIRVTALP